MSHTTGRYQAARHRAVVMVDMQRCVHKPTQAAPATATPRSAFIMSMNCSKQTSESWGPGEASGWYWMLIAFRGRASMPAQVPSLRLMCETSMSAGSVCGSTA